MYVKKFNDFIFDKEIVFSNNFKVSFKDGILEVEKVQSPLQGIYGDNIKNITVLCGKNGTGKTTIIDILGMNYRDRVKQLNESNEKKERDQYFLLYYLYENKDKEDIYGIEACGGDIFRDVIRNCEMGKDEDSGYNNSKGAIGVKFKYLNNKFIDTNQHFFSDCIDSDDIFNISQQLCVVNCNSIGRYSNRIEFNLKTKERKDDNYLAKRLYIEKPNYKEKYSVIRNLQFNYKNLGFFNESIVLDIKDNIRNETYYSSDYKEELNEIDRKLKKLLFLDDRKSFINPKNKKNMKKKSRKRIKELYILRLLSEYIIYEIINGLFQCIEMKNNLKSEKTDDLSSKIKSIFMLMDSINVNENTRLILGKPVDFNIEIKLIYELISKYNKKGDTFENRYNNLISISRYVNSRIEAGYEFGEENAYEVSIEQVLDQLIKIDKHFFCKDGLYVILNEDYENTSEEQLKNLLSLFDKYKRIESSKHNSLQNLFKIEYLNLSEGEKCLIDILGNVISAVKVSTNNKLVVILFDEPDCSLHPEWSRKFLSTLIEWINKLNLQVQIVLTTHSPYIVSDMFPQNIYRLSREEKNYLQIERLSDLSNETSSFGANIYDLLNNSFFMDNSIGEFATNYIKVIINYIEQLNDNTDNKIIEKIEFCIENIGDPFLRKALLRKYKEKQLELKIKKSESIDYDDILNIISNEDEKEKVKRLLEKVKGLNHDKN